MKHSRFKLLFLLVGIISFTLILTIANRTPIDSYIDSVKMIHIPTAEMNDKLYEELVELAKKIDQEPIDARVDRIWKAIPSHNGIKVNLEKSYQVAKQLGKVRLDMLMYDEIEAKVALEDLPVAPIYRGNPNKPMISLMINVAWGTEYVHSMLEIFNEYQVKATFFLDGKWLRDNQDVAKKILEHGHELGNHAYSHPDLTKMSVERIKEEMTKTNELIEKLGVTSYLFAPPSGAFDQRVVQIAHQYNMKTILWTLDTVDWKKPPSSTIVNRIVPNLENGALILMHPTEPTVAALPAIIEGAQNKELTIGTVSQLISPERGLSIINLD